MEKEELITIDTVKDTPAGGVLIGEKEGQTIIPEDGSMGGFLIGKLHKESGIKAVNKSNGQPLEMQGNEVVITAPAVADQSKREFEGKLMTNREILSKINSDGGGVSFAEGGEIPAKINISNRSYNFEGQSANDIEIANRLGFNSTLEKGKQIFTSGGKNYNVSGIYKAIKNDEINYSIKNIKPFAIKFDVYDKKYSESVTPDFNRPQGIIVRIKEGEELLIDGNHRMNNAYINGMNTIPEYYVNIDDISRFVTNNAFDDGGHLSKGMTFENIAKKHGVTLNHIMQQIAMGLEVEKEHTQSEEARIKIVKDHLVENPNYYTILENSGLENGGELYNSDSFMAYCFGVISDFLKKQNDVVLNDDFTFFYRGENFTIQPLLLIDKDDENPLQEASFAVLDDDGQTMGEIYFDANMESKNFRAESEFFEWDGLKFKNGGQITELLAPNGQPSNLNPEQYNLVRTEAFKNWFGDWEKSPETASKVVDENGEPLVVYHGTKTDFFEFELSKTGVTDAGLLGKGFYFTPSKQQAEFFSTSEQYGYKGTPKVMEVFLVSKKPEIISDAIFSDGTTLREVHPNGITTKSAKAINKKLLSKKFDGAIFKTDDELLQFFVFNPNQIKLADGTNTSFNPKTNDLRFDDGGDLEEEEDDDEDFEIGGEITDSSKFTFMKNSPMQRARALKALTGLVRYEDKVKPFYKLIESLPKDLKIETSKIYSSKSVKGYVEKMAIGNMVITYKAEADYYEYLNEGGYSYSKYLEDEKNIEEAKVLERQKESEAHRLKQLENMKLAEIAKLKQIKKLLEEGADKIILELNTPRLKLIEKYKKERQTNDVKSEIDYHIRMLEQTERQIKEQYHIAKELYKITNDQVEPKFSWKINDEVIIEGFINHEPAKIKTKIIEIKDNLNVGIYSFKVEKAEGINNQWIGYDGLFPATNKSDNNEIQEAIDVLKILAETSTKKEKKEILEALEVLEILNEENPKYENGGNVKKENEFGNTTIETPLDTLNN